MRKLGLHLAGRFAVWYLWHPSMAVGRGRAKRVSRLAWWCWGAKNRRAVVAGITQTLGQEKVAATAVGRESFALLLQNFADLGQTQAYIGRALPVEEKILDEAVVELFAQPTVWATGHFSAWEAACGALARKVSLPCNFTARGFSDPWLTARVSAQRRAGATPVAGASQALFVRRGRGGFAGALRGVLQGQESAVFFSDQRQVGAVKVQLLGQEVWFADTAVRLALRSGAGLACFRSFESAGTPRQIVVEFGPVLCAPHSGGREDQAEVEALCQKLADWYSGEILRAPEQWLWTRKRFSLKK